MSNDRFEVLYTHGGGHAPLMRFCRQTWFASYHAEMRSYEYLKVFRVTEGRAVWNIRGQHLAVSRGDILLLNNTERRAIRPSGHDEPFTMEYATCLPVVLPYDSRCLAAYFYRPPAFCNLLPRTARLYSALHDIFDLLHLHVTERMPLGAEAMKVLLRTLFITAAEAFLLEYPTLTDSLPTLREGARADERAIEECVRYIAENPTADLSENALASRAYMSKNRFIRLFRTYNGMTPSAYVRAFRIGYAIEMLSHGADSIADVAAESGFESLSGFYKAFTAVTGQTPRRLSVGQREK